MPFIIQSIILAPMVAWRMILPALGILFVAGFVWPVVSMLTLGFSDYVSGSITLAFIALIGIRTALSLKGDRRPTDYKLVALYSVAFGIIMYLAKSALVFASLATIIWTANLETFSIVALWQTAPAAEAMVQESIATLGWIKSIFIAIPFLAFAPVLFAVPMASVAQSIGRNAHSSSLLFWGRKTVSTSDADDGNCVYVSNLLRGVRRHLWTPNLVIVVA